MKISLKDEDFILYDLDEFFKEREEKSNNDGQRKIYDNTQRRVQR